MFASKSHAAFAEILTEQDFDKLLGENFAIIFKHSPTCLISRLAYSQMEQFHAARPTTPIHLISVRRHREVARYIAARTGVNHESPQVVVLRKGAVVASASHEQITVDFLEDLVRDA